MLFLHKTFGTYGVELSRRRFIRWVVFSGLASFSPSPVFAAIRDCMTPERSLSLYNPNTKEALDTIYWSKGNYVRKALADISHIMRDRRTGEIKPIDTHLLDLLHTIGMQLKTQEPFHIMSGYRTPQTNALLRKCGIAAAENSFHMQGKAVDICLPRCGLSSLRRVSINLRSGGVGYYPCSGFVHVDVGPLRYWSDL